MKSLIASLIILLLMFGLIINKFVTEKKSCLNIAKTLQCQCKYNILHGCKLKCKPTGSLFLDAVKEGYNGR